MESKNKFILLSEAAKSFPYSQEYLSLLARNKKISARKIGRNWYTTKEAIDEYAEKHENLKIFIPGFQKPILIAAESIGMLEQKNKETLIEQFERLNQPKPFKVIPKPAEQKSELVLIPPESRAVEKIKVEDDEVSEKLDAILEKIATPSEEQLTADQKKFVISASQSSWFKLWKFNLLSRELLRDPKKSMIIMVGAIILLFLVVGGFSFGQIDDILQRVKKIITDADTLQGHFPGTHSGEVLLLDKAGNISIYGHIETQGQLRSYAIEGVAPIVVDSITKVENLNVDYFDSLDSTDFTLAFVTKNGNITYEDVFLEGNVEVGKTLLVKGPAKLLNSLAVDGGIGVLSGDVRLKSGNLVLDTGTIKIKNTQLIENLNADKLDYLDADDFTLDQVLQFGDTARRMAFFEAGLWGKDAAFGSLGVKGDVTVGNQEDPDDSRFAVFSKRFVIDENGNLTASGKTKTDNLVVSSKVISNLIPSGSYDLGSAVNPWDELTATSASFSNLTVTGTGGGNFEGTTSSSFRINTDNATADTENSYLSFERGTTTPNAIIKWDSTNKQFNINQPLKIASVSFELSGTASISGDLIVYGSGSASGQLKAARAPVTAHTGTWPNFSGTGNATLYVNPSSSVADGNLFVAAIDGTPKFVVDAEGDVFGNNLILTGTTSQGTTSISANLTVEGHTTLGDASTDKIYFVGTVVPYTLTSIPLIIKASSSQTVDLFRINDHNDVRLLTVDFPSGLFVSSSGFNFAMGTSTATVSYSRLGTATTTHSNYISRYNDLLVSGDLEVDGSISAQFASVSQMFVMNNTASASAFFKSNGSGTNQSQFSLGVGVGTERLNIFNNANSPIFTIASSGNVGIGNTTLDAKLDVAGDILASTSGNVDFILRSSTTNGASNNDDAKFTIRTGSSSENFQIRNGANNKLLTIASASGLFSIKGALTALTGNNLKLQASGTTAGSTGSASIYFLDSSGTTKGRIETITSTFNGGNQTASSAENFLARMYTPSDVAPTAGGTLTINGVSLGSYDYTIKNGDETVSSFTESDWFTSTADRSAFIVVIGNLTINSGQVFKPASRKMFTVIYVTGNLTVNGEISMSARGANHSSTGSNITAGAIRLATGTFGGVTNPEVPAAGGAGGAAISSSGTGTVGTAGSAGGVGGGGSGGAQVTTGTSGAGAAGTSFSGGTGGGGIYSTAGATAGSGAASGGAGGAGSATGSAKAGGGAGNPGGAGGNGGTAGTDGTGGVLMIYTPGVFSGSGTVTAAGSDGGATGGVTGAGAGGSGGGSVTIFYGTDSSSITPTVAGGAGGAGGDQIGGAGGAGTARKLSGATTLGSYGTLFIGATNTTLSDLAEYYNIHDSSLSSGDVVSVDFDGTSYGLIKARDSDPILGIISTNPGLILGGGEEDKRNQRMVALAGRVPTKVSTENGPIQVGDRLAVSKTTPGYAMKATEAGEIIGIALDNFGTIVVSGSFDVVASGSAPLASSQPVEHGSIMVFIKVSYWAPSTAEISNTASGSSNVIIVSSLDFGDMASGSRQVLATIINTVLTKVQNLWASGDIIAEGIKKTYYSVALAFNWEFDLATMVHNWLSREIIISPDADDAAQSLLEGAQAAAESKLDLADLSTGSGQGNGNYLATYGVDSARGEILLSGTSKLEYGEAKVFFDFSFTAVISDKVSLKVLVTPVTDTILGQLVVINKTPFGFVVKELNAKSDGKFDWLVIARRKEYEGDDMAASPTPSLESIPEPTSQPTPEPSPSPSESPTPEPTSTLESSPEPTPEVSPSPSPEPTPEPEPTPLTESASGSTASDSEQTAGN